MLWTVEPEYTSYVTIPPEVAGWRSVAVHRAPFAEIMHVVRGPCWEKAIILDATSWKYRDNFVHDLWLDCQWYSTTKQQAQKHQAMNATKIVANW